MIRTSLGWGRIMGSLGAVIYVHYNKELPKPCSNIIKDRPLLVFSLIAAR